MKTFALIGLTAIGSFLQQTNHVEWNRSHEGVLTTPSSVECLTDATRIALSADRTMLLAPGVRLIRDGSSYVLSTYDKSRINIEFEGTEISLESPSALRLTGEGWRTGGGQLITAPALSLRRKTQDDADQNLKSMQEAARKLKSRQDAKPQAAKPGRFTYQENPFHTAEVFNKAAIQQLTHLSATGF